MRYLDNPQGSREWLRDRAGVITASGFSAVVTKTGKAAGNERTRKYLAGLAAERILGEPAGGDQTDWMERGNIMEPRARAWYELEYDVTVQEVGLCLMDDGNVGASVDGLVGDDGLIEIKCLDLSNHILALNGLKSGDHFVQIQGQMLVTGRAWCDLVFYNPDFPSVAIRMDRDGEWIDKARIALDQAVANLEAMTETVREVIEAERAVNPFSY